MFRPHRRAGGARRGLRALPAVPTHGRGRRPCLGIEPATGRRTDHGPRRCTDLWLDRRNRGPRAEQGTVTAETAVVLPVLVLLTLALVWLLSLAVTQVRVVDAARETARALARDESPAVALDLGRRVAPEGARFDVREGADELRVHVLVEVRGPGAFFTFLPAVEIAGEAVAAREAR